MEETELAFIRSLEIFDEGEKDEIQVQKSDISEISDNKESESKSKSESESKGMRESMRESRGTKRKRGISSEESSDESTDDGLLPAFRTSSHVRKRPDQPIGFHVID